jgi:hypothetical protein
MDIIIASYSDRYGLIGNIIAFYSYRFENMTNAIRVTTICFEVTLPTSE